MAYIDTSVLAAYYCPEALSAKATRELQRDRSRMISPFVELELISAIAMKTRTRELSTDDARAIVAEFRKHLAAQFFQIVEIGRDEYATASAWLTSFSTALRASDSLHLAAAFLRDIPLVTADRALAKAATALGVKCTTVEIGRAHV